MESETQTAPELQIRCNPLRIRFPAFCHAFANAQGDFRPQTLFVGLHNTQESNSMSITFFFEGDEKITRSYGCSCVFHDNKPEADCFECKGTGKVTFTSDKHEVNLSNVNALNLLERIGIEPDYCGSFDATWEFHQKVMVIWAITDHDYWKARLYDLAQLIVAARMRNADKITFG